MYQRIRITKGSESCNNHSSSHNLFLRTKENDMVEVHNKTFPDIFSIQSVLTCHYVTKLVISDT